jgi:tripartite-type tricarboxylate transporter receptor subunit TctC
MRVHANLAVLAGAMLAFAAPGTAQEYPTKPVRLVVPFPPGAANDTLARSVAAELSPRLGKQIVVDNRGGAGGMIGTEHVATSAPDGYTLLLTSSALTTAPYVYKLKFDPVKSFEPVSMLAIADPAIVAINPALPAKSIQEFIALAKAKPGELHLVHSGIGTFLHTSGLLFAKSAGINVVDVPFKGAGPAIQNILSGDSHFIVVGYSSLGPFLSSGRLRAIGVLSDKRSRYVPDVPTLAEQGLPGVTSANWFGIIAPAGTPQAIVQKLHKELAAVQDLSSFRSSVDKLGAAPWKLEPKAFRDFVVAELKKWEPILAGIKPQ